MSFNQLTEFNESLLILAVAVTNGILSQVDTVHLSKEDCSAGMNSKTEFRLTWNVPLYKHSGIIHSHWITRITNNCFELDVSDEGWRLKSVSINVTAQVSADKETTSSVVFTVHKTS